MHAATPLELPQVPSLLLLLQLLLHFPMVRKSPLLLALLRTPCVDNGAVLRVCEPSRDSHRRYWIAGLNQALPYHARMEYDRVCFVFLFTIEQTLEPRRHPAHTMNHCPTLAMINGHDCVTEDLHNTTSRDAAAMQ